MIVCPDKLEPRLPVCLLIPVVVSLCWNVSITESVKRPCETFHFHVFPKAPDCWCDCCCCAMLHVDLCLNIDINMLIYTYAWFSCMSPFSVCLRWLIFVLTRQLKISSIFDIFVKSYILWVHFT
ncbi:hypothetical protein XENORESO_012808 [Xenotaenia resolanae]|uniref:Secreted protein n=1 Tax=Xenotaenia resolanae TaxID=208358 RepID=A0ABV0X6L2_9TELE